jgi:hypothetical protein
MVAGMTVGDRPMLVRVVTHPAVWSLPVMALLVWLAMPFNDGFYETWVNYDPQGDAQQHEWTSTRWIFRCTSGVLCGQFLSVLVGVVLARRHRQVAALAMAVPLGALLAAVTAVVGFPLAEVFGIRQLQTAPLRDPVLVRLLECELAAFPLCAVAGVGVGVLLTSLPRRRRRWLMAGLGVAWWIAALFGLLQDDKFGGPHGMLGMPPVAAGAAVALAGLSVDVWAVPPVLVGDWGRGASIALLTGLAAYALIFNLFGFLVGRRRRRGGADALWAADPSGQDDPHLRHL